MQTRKLIISLAGVGILAAGIVISNVLSSGDENALDDESQHAATVVRTALVNNNDIGATIQITGRVIAAEKVDLFAEVTGVSNYGDKPFKAGNSFRKGQVLLRVDSRELASSLASAKSQFMSTLAKVLPDLKLDYTDVYPQWRKYLVNLNVDNPMPALPQVKNEQLKLFLTGRNVYSSYYSIREVETRLSKFVIRAPFNGTLTESSINQGTLVRTGQKLGEFIKNGLFELEGSILYNELNYLKISQTVELRDVNSNKVYLGKLARINEVIDPASQLIKVYFQLSDQSLKSGLYLEGDIPAFTVEGSVELPIQALVDNQFVFTVNDGIAMKQPVSIVTQDADSFIAKGLPEGAVVIIDKKNSAFEGSSVIEM